MFADLWRDRVRPPAGRSAAKLWARRLVGLPVFMGSARRAARLRRRGADVSRDCFLSPCHVGGPPRLLAIGAGTFIGRVRIEIAAAVRIGANVCLNDGVQLLTATHDVRDPHWGLITADIVIEDFAWVATDAVVLPGVTIGRGAVVGACAVVTRNVPAYAVAVGNPARCLPGRRPADLKYSPTRFLAPVTAWLGSPPGGG